MYIDGSGVRLDSDLACLSLEQLLVRQNLRVQLLRHVGNRFDYEEVAKIMSEMTSTRRHQIVLQLPHTAGNRSGQDLE